MCGPHALVRRCPLEVGLYTIAAEANFTEQIKNKLFFFLSCKSLHETKEQSNQRISFCNSLINLI